MSDPDFAEIKARIPDPLDIAGTYVYEKEGALKGFIVMAGDKIEMA